MRVSHEASSPDAPRRLIVNADDFGRDMAINRGVIRAHEQGIVTSASLMVHWPAAVEAARYGRDHSALGIGLHVDLGEWAFRNGDWRTVYEIVALDDVDAVRQEVERQWVRFRVLVGRNPTHLDSHQHVHRHEPVRGIMLDLANDLGVPLRGESPIIRHCGEFYGQSGRGEPYPNGITPEALSQLLRGLNDGVTELSCHPGEGSGGWSSYEAERRREVETLCDLGIRQLIERERIRLCRFPDISSSNTLPC
jgi:chitin disaccharide deacetylase